MKASSDPRRIKAEILGRKAEDVAAHFLENCGWHIVGKRNKTRYGEIDLIAQKKDVTAFIEVKARKNRDDAAAAITPRQAKRIIAAANHWLALNPKAILGDCRFDVILVTPDHRLEHIENAFGAEAW